MNWHSKFNSANLSVALGSSVFAHSGGLERLCCHQNKNLAYIADFTFASLLMVSS